MSFRLAGIGKTRNGTERNAREKFTHHLVTANVCVSTMCSTHTVPYKIFFRWVARKVVCKLNYCILGRKSSVRQRRRAPVAKRVRRLTAKLFPCYLLCCWTPQ